jgi:hypothetical protein
MFVSIFKFSSLMLSIFSFFKRGLFEFLLADFDALGLHNSA